MTPRLVSWACDEPHIACACGALVCLNEDPAAVDAAGVVTCPEHRPEDAA